MELVSVLFEYARKRQYIQRDSTLLDELEEWSEEDYDIEIFTPEAPEALRPVLMIGAFAGLRTAEIARLDWSEVNLEPRLIEVKARKAKTRARRLVPISENLAAPLKGVHQTTGPVWGKSVV